MRLHWGKLSNIAVNTTCHYFLPLILSIWKSYSNSSFFLKNNLVELTLLPIVYLAGNSSQKVFVYKYYLLPAGITGPVFAGRAGLTSKMSVWLDATKWLWLTKDEGLLLALEVVVVVLMRLLLVGDVTIGGCVLLVTVVPPLLVTDEATVEVVLAACSCWWACKAAATCCWCPIKAANCLDLKKEKNIAINNVLVYMWLHG